MAANVAGAAETVARIVMLQTPPGFGKKLERSEEFNEGEPIELKAKINGSPKPTVSFAIIVGTTLKMCLGGLVQKRGTHRRRTHQNHGVT